MPIETYDITDRAAWLTLRRNDVTASDIAAVCGLDPFKTRMRVYAEKAGLIDGVAETPAMLRGRHFEAAAVSWLREERPTWEIRRGDKFVRAPDLRIGATPDVVAIDPEREGFGVVQIKIVAQRRFNDDWRGGADDTEPAEIRAPIGYQLQTLTEAKLLGASWAVLAALSVSEFSAALHIVPVDLHEAAWGRIKDEVTYFWRCIETQTPPSLDAERDAETIAAMYPAPRVLSAIDLSADNELPNLIADRAALKESISEASDRVKTIETIIKAKLGDYESAVCSDGHLIKWKVEPRSSYVVAASEPRVLRISKPKAKKGF